MYRGTGAGKEPMPPALLAMALVLKGYLGMSDSDAVEATVLDLRWQLVLDCLGASEPPFSQGALQAFRERTTGAGKAPAVAATPSLAWELFRRLPCSDAAALL